MRKVTRVDELIIGNIYKFFYDDDVSFICKVTKIEKRNSFNMIHLKSLYPTRNYVDTISRKESLIKEKLIIKAYELTRNDYIMEIL